MVIVHKQNTCTLGKSVVKIFSRTTSVNFSIIVLILGDSLNTESISTINLIDVQILEWNKIIQEWHQNAPVLFSFQ